MKIYLITNMSGIEISAEKLFVYRHQKRVSSPYIRFEDEIIFIGDGSLIKCDLEGNVLKVSKLEASSYTRRLFKISDDMFYYTTGTSVVKFSKDLIVLSHLKLPGTTIRVKYSGVKDFFLCVVMQHGVVLISEKENKILKVMLQDRYFCNPTRIILSKSFPHTFYVTCFSYRMVAVVKLDLSRGIKKSLENSNEIKLLGKDASSYFEILKRRNENSESFVYYCVEKRENESRSYDTYLTFCRMGEDPTVASGVSIKESKRIHLEYLKDTFCGGSCGVKALKNEIILVFKQNFEKLYIFDSKGNTLKQFTIADEVYKNCVCGKLDTEFMNMGMLDFQWYDQDIFSNTQSTMLESGVFQFIIAQEYSKKRLQFKSVKISGLVFKEDMNAQDFQERIEFLRNHRHEYLNSNEENFIRVNTHKSKMEICKIPKLLLLL